jgi:hypothetical protein
MQFLFGMAMLQLIVTMTMAMVRAHVWAAKFAGRLAWQVMRAAWATLQDARWRWRRRRR